MNTGNSIVDKIGKVNISGNITPMNWYKTITRESGKPYLEAIAILSDIVYWYKPTEIRDETSGQVIGYKKKFKSDLLQRSYQQLSDMFGISKREATNAVVCLEKLGVLKRVFRTLTINNITTSNVLFLELNPEKLIELTFECEPLETAKQSEEVIAITFKSDTPHFQKGDPPLSKVRRNTEITTEITTENKKERKKEETENSKQEVENKVHTPRTFDEIIDSYTDNEELRKELKEHLRTRKNKKSSLTNRAIELSLKELDKLADTDEEKILIVQNSIMGGYSKFYKLKKDEASRLSESSFNIDEFEKYLAGKYKQ